MTDPMKALSAQQMVAARHDADAVLKYGNDAPAMRGVLARHLDAALATIAELKNEYLDLETNYFAANDRIGFWIKRAEAAEADNARLLALLKPFANIMPVDSPGLLGSDPVQLWVKDGREVKVIMGGLRVGNFWNVTNAIALATAGNK